MVGEITTVLRVALPTSILSVEHALALKSIRIHQVARWSSIFGVYEVVFYKEPSTTSREFKEHKAIIEDHWKYFFTPPYLRKQLVPFKPTLKHVGILPPIRLEIFSVSQRPRAGELRLGYVFRDVDGEVKALVGDNEPYVVLGNCKQDAGILPVIVRSEKERIVECSSEPVYVGPRLAFANCLKELLERYRKVSKHLIATDRKGEYPSTELVESMRGCDIMLLFGSPQHDLFEIASQEGFAMRRYVDYVWNTVPRQKVVTVRTEEALIITLGIVNAFLRGI
ncbi:MAG: putative RNA uridine N3 methyltransferase [Desulfurococcaceae archaeon]